MAMVGYSDGLVDIVSQMLHIDPKKRPTAGEILDSPYVRETMSNLRSQIAARLI
jgi:serine/threonine protein kinase